MTLMTMTFLLCYFFLFFFLYVTYWVGVYGMIDCIAEIDLVWCVGYRPRVL